MVQERKLVFYFVLHIAIIYTFLLCFTEPGAEVGTCILKKMRASSLKETFHALMSLELLSPSKTTPEKDSAFQGIQHPLMEKNRRIRKQREYMHYCPLFRKSTPKYSTVDVFVTRA